NADAQTAMIESERTVELESERTVELESERTVVAAIVFPPPRIVLGRSPGGVPGPVRRYDRQRQNEKRGEMMADENDEQSEKDVHRFRVSVTWDGDAAGAGSVRGGEAFTIPIGSSA